MTVDDILEQLESYGSESYKKTLLRHGAVEPIYGVKISDIKKIQKKIKEDQELAIELYETGNYDAMYLAGLIAVPQKMTMRLLRRWLKQATSPMIAEYTIPWLAAESPHGFELSKEWIISKNDPVSAAGWATLCSLVNITEDEELGVRSIKQLIQQVEKTIDDSPDRTRYWMNNFIISAGCCVAPLTKTAKKAAKKIGKVSVDMGETACKVPDAVKYIKKVEERGGIGKKRKTARC